MLRCGVRYYDFDAIVRALYDSAVTGEVIKPILRMPGRPGGRYSLSPSRRPARRGL